MKTESELVQALDALDCTISARRFIGYGPREIPHELDAIPGWFIRCYSSANADDRELPLALGGDAASVLTVFSERQAALAVRAQSLDILMLDRKAVAE